MKPRPIQITPVLNGFVIQAGCQTVVVTSVATLVAEIACYYTNPEEAEKRYIATAVNKTMDGPAVVAQDCCESAPERPRAPRANVDHMFEGKKPYGG